MTWSDEDREKSLATRRAMREHRAQRRGARISTYRRDGLSWDDCGELVGVSGDTAREYLGVYMDVGGEGYTLPNHSAAKSKHLAWVYHNLGMNSTEIGKKMNAKPATVRKWISRWTQELEDEYLKEEARLAEKKRKRVRLR